MTESISPIAVRPAHLPHLIVSRRWRYWEPQCAYASCQLSGGPALMAEFKQRHLTRCQRLIASGIAATHWERIAEQRLDDPILSPELWEARFERALENKRKHTRKDHR